MLATAQMNVRIPADLKRCGDESFASIGVTPTEAVRALWEKAADRGKGLSDISKLLFAAPPKEEELPLVPGPDIVERGLKSLGITIDADDYVPIGNDDLMELALEERFSERGLL